MEASIFQQKEGVFLMHLNLLTSDNQLAYQCA